jgi:glucose-6-phosphate 1-dehydrogenase
MNNCAIVIFGATGDLTKRKLIPAIYRLVAAKKLTNFVVIGAAIDDISVDTILSKAKGFVTGIDEQVWQKIKERTFYQKLDFANQDDFNALHDRVVSLEKQFNLSGNRLLYLAAAAFHFSAITKNSAASSLARRMPGTSKVWHRIVYEKPFGHDLASAHQINLDIADSFEESQVYRIDHYLTKELVSNITLVRFTNCFFEPLWNKQYIDHVQIVLNEQVCLEGRGGYYDAYGALRDVVQNHMLELLALIGMEAPEKLAGDFVRTARAKVLEKVKVVDGVLGQYEGYLNENGVAPHSQTDTFAALYVTIDNHRWQGVPFYLKTGKCLDNKEIAIHIKFSF